ncbi:MAG: 4-hydroxy-tetrahydrodipicolinate synthase [Firmicutes bacterium]|nr:4-hydroxy-tetrahydrodipicolinate synthase [Bacillota bacterium]
MKKPVFTGSAVAICTPFNNDGSIDYDALGRLIDWQISDGTSAVVLMGTTGENPTISDDEFSESVKFAAGHINKRVPLIVGTGRNDTAHSVKLSKIAKNLGADALLVVTPYYNKTTQRGLIVHTEAIAAATDLPIILYNVPSRTGMSFTADTYAQLAKIPTINGVKEASGNFTLMLQTFNKCPADFYMYSGNDDQITPMMSLGAVGVISVLANIMPKETAEICRFALEGDYKRSSALQIDLCDIIDALFVETNPIPVKAALDAMGRCGGTLRLPLVDMGERNRQVLMESMKKHGLI